MFPVSRSQPFTAGREVGRVSNSRMKDGTTPIPALPGPPLLPSPPKWERKLEPPFSTREKGGDEGIEREGR